MYIQKTGNPINFNSSGQPTNTSAVVTSTETVNGNTTKTLTASTNIQQNVTYEAILIVTNPDFSGYHNSVTSKALIPGASGNKNGVFHIQAAGQSGEIVYDIVPPTANNQSGQPDPGLLPVFVPTVGYNFSGKTTANDNLFHHDPDDLVCTVMLSQSGSVNIDPGTKCGALGDNTYILYDPSLVPTSGVASGSGTLGIKKYSEAEIKNPAAKWTYDQNKNTICLKDYPNRCMTLPSTTFVNTIPVNTTTFVNTTPVNTTPVNTTTPITLTSPGTSWNIINFEISSST